MLFGKHEKCYWCNSICFKLLSRLPHLKKGKHILKKMCETRWVEKHDAVLTFFDTLPCLPIDLETISESSESSGSNAFSFLHAIYVVVLAEVFELTLPLVRKLQAEYMEETLASLRDTDTFKKIFKESEMLAMEMGTQINKPRTTNLQKKRSNFNSQTVEEYSCTAVFPKSELQRVGQIQKLLSPEFCDGFEDEVLQGAKPYKDDLTWFSVLKGELQVRKQTWKSDPSQNFPKSPAEDYKQASAIPNVRVLSQLLCVLPVTTNTVERSFSTLGHLKTYLRSTMTEDRLNGLALLHIQ
ncbi:hypothetical protein PR048_019425 [Dryococelus australis]|uniref:HAT C-terminal dimerisation domain-containing protein n=1 Tax=Dryococelus australis TaxID=614101 RepID=A0ABQ9H3G6_9NEOP|nr:hypothetical protein PR048_019425 [Dryococelus australis]